MQLALPPTSGQSSTMAAAGRRASIASSGSTVSLAPSTAAYAQLLSDSFENLSLASRRGSRTAISSSSGSSTYELFSPTLGSSSSAFGGRTIPLFGGASASIVPSSRRSSFGSSSSTIVSGTPSSRSEASLLVVDFFSDSSSFVSDASTSASTVRERKLQLWQAFLLDFGVCSVGPDSGAEAARPAHFPSTPLPLPGSLTKCKQLIRQYLFINLKDYMESVAHGGDAVEVFSSAGQLCKYTRTERRFIRLSRAKEGYLSPFLRRMRFYPTLGAVHEESESDGE